jgi:hypothetical protein
MGTIRNLSICLLTLLMVLAGASSGWSQCVATGDANCSGGLPTMGDVAVVIDFFELGGAPGSCFYQMDVNGDCVVDRTDFYILLECLRIGGECPQVTTCCNPTYDRLCCSNGVGDPNGSNGEPSIGDISVIIDALFGRGNCDLICVSAADINGSGGDSPTCEDITISDISMLIDCLFISGNIAPCYVPCS